MTTTAADIQEMDRKISDFLVALKGLPRFDRAKKASENQGDILEVEAAVKAYHTWNKEAKKLQKSVGYTGLTSLYLHEEWKNFTSLRTHTKKARACKKKRNAAYRAKTHNQAWRLYFAKEAKIISRVDAWWNSYRPIAQVAAENALERYRGLVWVEGKGLRPDLEKAETEAAKGLYDGPKKLDSKEVLLVDPDVLGELNSKYHVWCVPRYFHWLLKPILVQKYQESCGGDLVVVYLLQWLLSHNYIKQSDIPVLDLSSNYLCTQN